MRFTGSKTLRSSILWARSRFTGGALILGYHRVVEEAEDPYRLCVSPERFEKQLEAIRRLARPLRLGELVSGLEGGELPQGAVAVTFDDGYADVLYEAKPLLERHEIPATVFVVSGRLGREFWWDALRRLTSPPASLPACFRLEHPAGCFEWPSARCGRSVDGGSRRRRRGEGVRGALFDHLLPLRDEEKWETLETLSALAERSAEGGNEPGEPMAGKSRGGGPGASDVSRPGPARLRRSLDGEEVLRLVDGGLIEVGSHTVTHALLTALPEHELCGEIRGSREELEALLGRPVRAFAYPHGATSRPVAEAVQQAGFRSACASANDVVRKSGDPFRLPRFWPTDSDGEGFSRWLRRWLPG